MNINDDFVFTVGGELYSGENSNGVVKVVKLTSEQAIVYYQELIDDINQPWRNGEDTSDLLRIRSMLSMIKVMMKKMIRDHGRV